MERRVTPYEATRVRELDIPGVELTTESRSGAPIDRIPNGREGSSVDRAHRDDLPAIELGRGAELGRRDRQSSRQETKNAPLRLRVAPIERGEDFDDGGSDAPDESRPLRDDGELVGIQTERFRCRSEHLRRKER